MAGSPDNPVRVRAQAKWVRMSARKARIVLDHVRGRSVPEARTVLAFTPRAAAREINRVLSSAVANAESVHALDGDELRVASAYADEGPTLKRWRARARGRASRIHKRTCHITIVLEPDPKAVGRPRRTQRKAAQEKPAPKPEPPKTPAGTEEPGGDAPEAPKRTRRKAPAKKEVAA
jgi:ribosomal protein L22